MAALPSKLLIVVLLCLTHLPRVLSKAFRHHKRIRKEAEGESGEELDLSGYTAGLANIGGFLVVIGVFYLINNQRTVVRKIIWQVANNTVSIFCAVLIFQTVESLCRFATLWCNFKLHMGFTISPEFRMRVVHTQSFVWILVLYFRLSTRAGVGGGMWFRLSIFKDSLTFAEDKNGMLVCQIFAHLTAFASIKGFAILQTTQYDKSWQSSLVPIGFAAGEWIGIIIVLGIIRRYIKHSRIQFFRGLTKVKLHYRRRQGTGVELNGKEATLLSYEEAQNRWTVQVNGESGTRKVKLEHIGVPAIVTSNAAKSKGILHKSLTKMGQATGISRAFSRLYEERGSANKKKSKYDSALHHLIIAGHKVEDDPSLQKGDEVTILCTHHYPLHDMKRYRRLFAVVQKGNERPTNVAWKRLQFKYGDPFQQGPFSHHDPMVEFWEEQIEEGENDIVAMVTSFLLVQSLRFYMCGVLPNEDGREAKETLFQKSWKQVGGLYICALYLLLSAFLHPFILRQVPLLNRLPKLHQKFGDMRLHAQRKGLRVGCLLLVLEEIIHGVRRVEAILVNFCFFAMCWCIMFASKWAFATEGFPSFGSRKTVSVCLAICITLAVFLSISLLNPLIQLGVKRGLVDRFEKDMVKLMQTLGFLVGFTWEHVFDDAIDAVADTLADDEQYSYRVNTVLSILCLTLLIPPWQRYIIPMVGEKAFTLGFNTTRIIDTIKVAFHDCQYTRDKEKRAKQIKELARHYLSVVNLLDLSFVVNKTKGIQPSMMDLQDKEAYIDRLLEDVDVSDALHPRDDHRKALHGKVEKIVGAPPSKTGNKFATHVFDYRLNLQNVGKQEEEDLDAKEEEESEEEGSDEEDGKPLCIDRCLDSIFEKQSRKFEDEQRLKLSNGLHVTQIEEASQELQARADDALDAQAILTPFATSFLNLAHSASLVRFKSPRRHPRTLGSSQRTFQP